MSCSKRNAKAWPWPYQRWSDGPEFACRHGIGHSVGVHGCDGCCKDKDFPRDIRTAAEVNRREDSRA
jgi:hypothetical protein